ncbi:uncharacterized protein METZ01_LOCUS254098 [marine metagenome]|uniref:TIGR00725 family protein n=1 Tax=marine metagenome TaxID=408172 RepID=A0A382INA2_9ZZZZ
MNVQISVIGASNPPPQAILAAESVGRELAQKGAVLVTGGLGGIMEAASKGARQVGGTTIGILPGSDPKEANPYVDIAICTGMGYARNIIVVKSGQAVIAIDGAFGTLSEIGHALGDGIPIVALNTWTITKAGSEDKTMIIAKTPKDAVNKAIEAAYGGQANPSGKRNIE